MLLGRYTSKGIPWLQLLVEAALVVMSVMFALALDSWRQSQVNDQLARQALQSIRGEVESNQQQVEQALSYHEALLDSLREEPGRGISLRAAFILNNAWETAQATGAAAHIDYATASVVSEMYSMQEQYQQLSQATLQAIYMGNVMGTEGRAGFTPIIHDFISFEMLLLRLYERVLQRIEA